MANRILLKTTIGPVEDDWNIARFSILKQHLEALGHAVEARDRVEDERDDTDLIALPESDFDQLWLFAVDVEDALTEGDAAAISVFRRRGGGLLVTRDHEDMGASLLRLGSVGVAHHFHSSNQEPDRTRHAVDDQATSYLSWPNYHTGANGDYQEILTPVPSHDLLRRSDGSPIQFLPAHPHEGVVSCPKEAGGAACKIIRGRSVVTGNQFGIAVAFDGERDEDGRSLGRAVAQSTFHHFVDPNLDPSKPLPSFCTEEKGSGMVTHPKAAQDSLRYIENLADWLSAQPTGNEL
ncbi:MAG: hypothetical protein AAFX52_02085 [Pseudomonadota bacterium]